MLGCDNMWKKEQELERPLAYRSQVGGMHYLSMSVQPWEAMRAWMNAEEFAGYLRGNVIKYIARCGTKEADGNPIHDLKKAQHYLETLIAFHEEQDGGTTNA